MSDTTVYERNLEHIAKPDTAEKRLDADHMALQSYEALYLCFGLKEVYMTNDDLGNIALGLVQFIEDEVARVGDSMIRVYAHTDEAKRAVFKAMVVLDKRGDEVKELQLRLFDKFWDSSMGDAEAVLTNFQLMEIGDEDE